VAIAFRTRSRASTETERGPLLITYETVEGTTRANVATSLRVTCRVEPAAARVWLRGGIFPLPRCNAAGYREVERLVKHALFAHNLLNWIEAFVVWRHLFLIIIIGSAVAQTHSDPVWRSQ